MDHHSAVFPRGEAPFDFYKYNPSATAGWAFLILFAIGGTVHSGWMIYLRSWFFIPLILGCAGEAGGYWGRIKAHDHIRSSGPYLLQMMLLLASPPFLACTIYMTLGRIIRNLDAHKLSLIRTTWLTKLYIVIDVGSFVAQIMGSAMQASADGAAKGVKIVTYGLVFQEVAFVFFLLIAGLFHVRLNRTPTPLSRHPQVRWQRHMWALYATSGLIFVRNLYRIVEFVQGGDGTVATHEAFMYVLDAGLMLSVVVVFAVVHPGQLMRAIQRVQKSPGLEEGRYGMVSSRESLAG
ncbi:uncharacterized protein K452DRAFT_271181 [Aplosporella prunicola CBS 121167]|uniref:RTA1 domain protein n=1 Tax=Aplosporella prunicola CBS 121167 TaxID=1176127 RepID=A0A6A6BDW1_9PEZI|nr:uncharacterized protein K452DRAFT_271181 [Aplosporella prunicola CBS 121167]KAF2141573.1 hypothetical protein K452DRAFT_271181 [Aplosporella prunicola CBS 121167]